MIETLEHMKRVNSLCLEFSKRHKLDVDMDILSIASLNHDLGKSKILDIINKKSKLTKEETDLIKLHCIYGMENVLELGYSIEYARVVLYHHENYDGTGYFKLKKKEIPLESSILRMFDVFDSLISNRPYRGALSIDNAIGEMVLMKGAFSPDLFNLFLESHYSKALNL